MYQSKLFTLLRGIDPSELRWLHKFLKSPFYNTNQQYLQLFEYIKKYHPDLESPKLTKEAAHKKLFPKEKFNVQRMRKMMHELTVLVEDFMVAQHFHNDQKARKKVLTEELGRRNIYPLFEKGIEEQQAALEAQPFRNEAYFLERFELREDLFGHPSTVRQKDAESHLLALSEDLDKIYFLKKLAIGVSLESARNIYSMESELPFFEEILAEIEKRELGDVPAIRLYVLVYHMFRNKENEYLFEELYDFFLKEKDNLGIENREVIIRFLINYSTFQINKGKDKYVKINFELYKIGLNDNLFIHNNLISNRAFSNIITAGCFLKEFDWTSKFLEELSPFLDDEGKNEVLPLCKANLSFGLENFSKTIDILVRLSPTKIHDKIRVKTLLIKSYVELYFKDESYYDLVFTQLETFDRYIRREKMINESNKKSLLNLIRSLQKLINLKLQQEDLTAFNQKIHEFDSVSNKPWLLSKAQ